MKRFVATAIVNAATAVAWVCIMPPVLFVALVGWLFAWCYRHGEAR